MSFYLEVQATQLPGKSIYASQLEEKPGNEIRRKSYLVRDGHALLSQYLWGHVFSLSLQRVSEFKPVFCNLFF